MTFLLYLISQLTYKRFLLFWATLGMLITHSWLTEPWNPEIWHQLTRVGLYSSGLIGFFGLVASIILNRFNIQLRFPRPAIEMVLYLFMAIFSSLINTASIEPYPILQLAIPIGLGLSFIYFFSQENLDHVLKAIALYGLANLLFTYVLFVFSQLNINTDFPTSGFFTDRNGFTKYISVVNAYFLIKFILQKNSLKRTLYAVILTSIFFGILIQYSRSGYIVYFISSAIIIFMSNSKRIKKLSLILLPIILVVFVIFTINRIRSEKMDIANSSDLGRVYVGKAGLNMIKAHPLWGIGYRVSELKIQEYADKSLPGLPNLVTIHNWFIVVWAEMGIFGFLVFLSLNVNLLFRCYKKVKAVGFIEGKYALFSFASIVIFMFDAQVLPNYDYESIYWILIAISVISLKNNNNLNYSDTVNEKKKPF